MASDGQIVAVLGAGSTMGFPMAQNMLKAGHRGARMEPLA